MFKQFFYLVNIYGLTSFLMNPATYAMDHEAETSCLQRQNAAKGSAPSYTVREVRARFYQKNGFILCEPISFGDKTTDTSNDPDLKKLASTSIKDGKVYDATGNLLDTKGGIYLYVLDYKGKLYTARGRIRKEGAIHHPYFLKSKPGKIGYGIGEDVACAGELIATEGKLLSMNNSSGNYMPLDEQLKISVQFLYKKDIFVPKAKIILAEPGWNTEKRKELFLESIICENTETLLAAYPTETRKRTREYIEFRRNEEKAFEEKLEHLKLDSPRSFLGSPVTDLFPNFQIPYSEGKFDFGIVEVENKKWKVFIENGGANLPKIILEAPASSFSWAPYFSTWFLKIPFSHKGIETRYPACSYSIMHPEKSFSCYLIPLESDTAIPNPVISEEKPAEKNRKVLLSLVGLSSNPGATQAQILEKLKRLDPTKLAYRKATFLYGQVYNEPLEKSNNFENPAVVEEKVTNNVSS